jgi:hypothetical protein
MYRPGDSGALEAMIRSARGALLSLRNDAL